MPAQVIDGKHIAAEIKEEIKAEVEQLQIRTGRVPGLATVLVGDRKDSQTYVRMKKRACKKVGITSFSQDLPEDVSEVQLLKIVRQLNENPDVHGILVQLPLPGHIDEEKILSAVSIEKDVDGFHPYNIGSLAMKGRNPLYVPCTPKGCIELLKRTGVEIQGKNAVVVGRSNIVGLPVAMLLLKSNATLTICHSHTDDISSYTKRADILIAALGKAEFIRGDWIKKGAVVIDVGMNDVEDPESPKGYRLVGDVNYEEAQEQARAITPVPGGVGPMTIAMLLRNTLESAQRILL